MTEMSLTFRIYISKMEAVATKCADEDRRLDAVQTLALICLLLDGWKPDPPDGGGEVIDLSQWKLRAA